jgi:hypothetical protein
MTDVITAETVRKYLKATDQGVSDADAPLSHSELTAFTQTVGYRTGESASNLQESLSNINILSVGTLAHIDAVVGSSLGDGVASQLAAANAAVKKAALAKAEEEAEAAAEEEAAAKAAAEEEEAAAKAAAEEEEGYLARQQAEADAASAAAAEAAAAAEGDKATEESTGS